MIKKDFRKSSVFVAILAVTIVVVVAKTFPVREKVNRLRSDLSLKRNLQMSLIKSSSMSVANINNPSRNLEMVKINFTEYERSVKNSLNAKETVIKKFRDYTFVLKNISTIPVAAFAIEFNEGNKLKRISTSSLKLVNRSIKPQEQREHKVSGVDSEFTPRVKMVLMDDGTYEGDQEWARRYTLQLQGAKEKFQDVHDKLQTIIKLSDLEIDQEVNKITQDIESENTQMTSKKQSKTPSEVLATYRNEGASYAILSTLSLIKNYRGVDQRIKKDTRETVNNVVAKLRVEISRLT